MRLQLQLFAEDKPFPATPRKRQEARKRGQVFRSQEATAAAVVLAALVACRYFLPLAAQAWQDMVCALWSRPLPDLDWDNLALVVVPAGRALALGALPVMGVALLAGLAVNLGQVGFLFSTGPLSLDFGRLDPVRGLGRLFSRRSLAELLKGLLKVTIVGYVCYLTVSSRRELLVTLPLLPLPEALRTAGQVAYQMVLWAGAGFVILAAADWFYQRWEYEVSLRMSRQELKEEFRQTEGNPELRARIRRRQREISRLRMLAEVARADVVVRNPTTYAVALRYDPATMDAPVVVAKGKGHLAQRIITLARKHWVTVVENRQLAQSLYSLVEVGQAIPPQLYQAVAEVLAFVYRLTGRQIGGGDDGGR
ncbi:MAG: flagellar biosynthesis protein FlhB [Bacillota bacterium]